MEIHKKLREETKNTKENLRKNLKRDFFFAKSISQPPIEEFEDNIPSTSKKMYVLLPCMKILHKTMMDVRRKVNKYYCLNLLNLIKAEKRIVNDELIDFVE